MCKNSRSKCSIIYWFQNNVYSCELELLLGQVHGNPATCRISLCDRWGSSQSWTAPCSVVKYLYKRRRGAPSWQEHAGGRLLWQQETCRWSCSSLKVSGVKHKARGPNVARHDGMTWPPTALKMYGRLFLKTLMKMIPCFYFEGFSLHSRLQEGGHWSVQSSSGPCESYIWSAAATALASRRSL